MAGFFIFIASMFSDLVGLYFDLPFLDGVSLGDMLVAIAILGVVASALVGQLSSFNLRHEASEANRVESENQRWLSKTDDYGR